MARKATVAHRLYQRRKIAPKTIEADERKVSVSVSLPISMIRWLTHEADKRRMGVSTFLCAIVQSMRDQMDGEAVLGPEELAAIVDNVPEDEE